MKTDNINKTFVVFLSALFLCAGAVCAFAELKDPDLPDREGIRLGRLRVHAAVNTQEQFDSNIYLANGTAKSDFITILSPSVGLEMPFSKKQRICADYEMGINLYGTVHGENHVDQRVRGLAEAELGDFHIVVKDQYDIFTNRAANENSVRIRQNVNNFRVGVDTVRDRIAFDVGYANALEMYASNDPCYQMITYGDRDRFINSIDATISYRFLPKTYALLENVLGFINYYNSSLVPGSWYDETVFGIKGEWFKKANVNFKAGFRYQSYDTSDIISDKAYIGPVLRGGMDWFVTGRDTIWIGAERTVFESTYANMNYYNANTFGGKYDHRFNDKLAAGLFGSYQLNLYPSTTTENGETDKRYDNFLIGGMSIRYDMRKWVSFEAKYEYRQRISRFDVFNYIDNLVSLQGTVGF